MTLIITWGCLSGVLGDKDQEILLGNIRKCYFFLIVKHNFETASFAVLTVKESQE